MKVFVIALFLTIPVLAQNTLPTIKGHLIGESLTDYLVVAKGGRDNAVRTLTECSALVSNPKQQKRRYSDRNLNESELKFQSDFDECLSMAAVLEGKKAMIQNGLQEFLFSSQKLVMIKLTILDDFDKVERDLVQKYGPPDREEQVQYQNAFGATFLHPRASWLNRTDVVVIANEEAKPVIEAPDVPRIYPVVVSIMDRKWSDAISAEERNRPSSLD